MPLGYFHRQQDILKNSEVIDEIMETRILPHQERFGDVIDIWNRLLPEELSFHCKIVEISGGQLKVQVDSPSYLYELKLCGSQLLTQLHQECGSTRIRRIKFFLKYAQLAKDSRRL